MAKQTTTPLTVTNPRYRQAFHIMTPGGWLNDPNGVCYFKGYYHVFYQFNPYSAEWGPMHWGHVRSKDLLHWEQLPIALTPGDPEDTGGCFSGSAIVKDDRLYLIYTGHHYYRADDLDHFWENQNVAYSDDGIHFTKAEANPVIEAPADNTQDFRDPKVWEHNGKYYLVVGGSQTKGHLGRLLFYESTDLLHWQFRGPIGQASASQDEGFMWECPDTFRLNGADVTLFSPMGMQNRGHAFLNENPASYFVGHLDYQTATYRTDEPFHSADSGHNFYATQTFLAPDGRRIMWAWMSPFAEKMAEQADGWAGCLTMPRELTLKNGRLCQAPIQEFTALRQKKDLASELTLNSTAQTLALKDAQHSEVILKGLTGVPLIWQLADEQGSLITLTYQNGELTLAARDKDLRYAACPRLTALHFFVDTSSVEIFVNDGETTFTERFYTTGSLYQTLQSKQAATIQATGFTLGLA